jgi:hypothetical protein
MRENGQEPVAWRVWNKTDANQGEWDYVETVPSYQLERPHFYTVNPLYLSPSVCEGKVTEEMSNLTKAELDIVLREAFPNVRDEDMGDHVTLILCQKGPQNA